MIWVIKGLSTRFSIWICFKRGETLINLIRLLVLSIRFLNIVVENGRRFQCSQTQMQFAGPYRNKKAISFVLYCTMSQHWKLLQLLLDVFTHIPNKTEQFFVVFF